MRPARGRLAAATSASKSRSCVVRLEKFPEENEDERKKMTGPLKKRPVVMKKSPIVQTKTRRRGAGEDLSEYMLVTARARRTPKPNPKYSNEDIVTPRNKSKDEDDESDGAEPDEFQSSGQEEEIPDDTSEEEFQPRKPVTRGVMQANGEILKRGPGRPPKIKTEENEIKPVARGAQKRRLDFDGHSKFFDAILAQNKRLNIELYDASDSDASVISPSRRVVRGSALRQAQQQLQKQVARIAMKPQQKSEPKKFPENSRGRPAPAPKIPTSEEDEDDPDDYDTTTGVASTMDDFETMPTFTIVNINDIINKKGDVLIQKTSQQRTSGGAPAPVDHSSNQTNDRADEETQISPTQASRNRRKSMHTTILSDKIDPEKLKHPPPRSPFPLRKPVVMSSQQHHSFNNNTLVSAKSLLNSNQLYKSAPRILNSVLARKNKAIQQHQEQQEQKQKELQLQQQLQAQLKAEIQLKQQQQQQQQQQQSQANHKNNNNQTQSKENHFNNFRSALAASAAAQKASAAAAATVAAPKANTTRKLPPEKVLIQRQGNKLIKKITCFETWYVINIPPAEATATPKLLFEMSLMQLGNTIKDVQLPSSDWTYKVTLQKLTQNQLVKLDEHFTGEVQDGNIDPDEKYKYHPVNVMFRRMSRNQKLRMPYDRAVIFKNKTYFTNIDGKNVRLVGAPNTIGSLDDLEILLQIVDEMTLISPFVEQTTYIL